jgi:hypothetical protein
MEVAEILSRLGLALSKFCEVEYDLLEQDAHEEAISTALIKYLEINFADLGLNIDGQYDKRWDNDELKKKETQFLITQLPASKMAGKEIEDKWVLKQVLPDVIIHSRKNNRNNFLVIEIKKSTNKNADDREYDFLKLQVFTGSDLKYEYGAFIEFKTGKDYKTDSSFNITLFNNGQILK